MTISKTNIYRPEDKTQRGCGCFGCLKRIDNNCIDDRIYMCHYKISPWSGCEYFIKDENKSESNILKEAIWYRDNWFDGRINPTYEYSLIDHISFINNYDYTIFEKVKGK